MPAYLETIVAAHRAEASKDRRDVEAAIERAGRAGPTRPFADALRRSAARQGMALISEIKRRSPSAGDLDADLDPAELAADYEAGGAACLSVLTDRQFFGGSAEDLQAARAACSLPVLRKDFTVSALDVCDARAMGADAVLLIVAALGDTELASFLELSRRCALTALVEVHDEIELKRAVDAGADVIGVNQRDLQTFEVDHGRAVDLGALLPEGVLGVAESGIRGPDDVRRLARAGYRAVLVGETLVRSGDRRAAVAGLLGAGM
ncbi:MAG TPA: indole-3-glycerol phosphate synthase TrpC [Acidimicrobiales bacterium]|nr:indole-3-glycerol phosphate synthase TrpC [Acidimicrobiales bacterium]